MFYDIKHKKYDDASERKALAWIFTCVGVLAVVVVAIIGGINLVKRAEEKRYDLEHPITITPTPNYTKSNGNKNTPKEEYEECWFCYGRGTIMYHYGASDLEAYLDGQEPYTFNNCGVCNGTGKVKKKK